MLSQTKGILLIKVSKGRVLFTGTANILSGFCFSGTSYNMPKDQLHRVQGQRPPQPFVIQNLVALPPFCCSFYHMGDGLTSSVPQYTFLSAHGVVKSISFTEISLTLEALNQSSQSWQPEPFSVKLTHLYSQWHIFILDHLIHFPFVLSEINFPEFCNQALL